VEGRKKVTVSTRRFEMAKEKKQEGKMDMQAMMDVYKKLEKPRSRILSTRAVHC
jgi:hypothetical protein